ncbi:MAG TPA: serine/threonine-protein kinase, partial [Polyangiales bacterium]|nr:serine/threonine-protein kinase [Polyangiales bacterium]
MSAPKSLEAGEVVGGKYVIERLLGEGGMGAVYLAHHRHTGRRVALKSLHSDDGTLRARLQREARALGKLSHPNVVGVLDAGDHDGAVFVVMEYTDGANLRTYMENRTVTPGEAVDLLMPAMMGIAAAHQVGILHRDLKPENLFVCVDVHGAAFDTKVLDFGVAKSMDADDTSLTSRGSIVGTPKYMAPEQITQGDSLDARMDVYALALILYEMLCGRVPYKNLQIKQLVVEILAGNLTSPKVYRPDLPDALVDVIMCGLATERENRYPDVMTFARALEPFAGKQRFSMPRMLHTPDMTLDDVLSPAFVAAAQKAATVTVTVDRPADKDLVDASARTKGSARPKAAKRAAAQPAQDKVRVTTERGVGKSVARPATGANTMKSVEVTVDEVPRTHGAKRGLFLLSALVLLMIVASLGWGAWMKSSREASHAAGPSVPPAQPLPEPAAVASPTPAPT